MDKSPTRPVDSLLVNPGKSSRLQEMRQRAAMANQPAPAPTQANVKAKDENFSPELALARDLIDQRLNEILAALPVGKQRRLFKIRFGMEPEQIRALPIKQVFALLEINHRQLNNSAANMKRIADLNYNGQPAN